jgi:pimeloyl-ACP methyl ester carboxylesterase
LFGVLAALTLTSVLSATSAVAEAVEACPVGLEVRHAEIDGTGIAWAELGRGRPLLLLNGTASPMAEWDPALLAALARDRRVIVLDYPGLGSSGPAPGRWTFPAAADWIGGFLAQVVPGQRVDVLGWSMGGFIAQQLAIQHPDRVRRLVLAATNPGGPGTVLGPRWVQEADSSGDSLAAYLRTNFPVGQRDAGRRFVARVNACLSTGVYPDDRVPAATRRAMVDAEDPWLRSTANVAALVTVAAPTLVITGRDDVVTPPANSRLLARAIPGSTLRLVRDAGHSFLFQRPDATARIIAAFLSN